MDSELEFRRPTTDGPSEGSPKLTASRNDASRLLAREKTIREKEPKIRQPSKDKEATLFAEGATAGRLDCRNNVA